MSNPTRGTWASQTKETVPVRDEGFTILSEGLKPIADVVFIHGLQGHPEKTWTFAQSKARQPKADKPKTGIWHGFSCKSRMSLSRTTSIGASDVSVDSVTKDPMQHSVFWPADILARDFSVARVLTYGYDSKATNFFTGPANQNNIFAHGRGLLHALEVEKREAPLRPTIFVVHSLGGIILKEALRRSFNASDEDIDLRGIYLSTYGIIFMGTPHLGSSYATWGLMAKNIVVAAGFDANDKNLQDLKVDSGTLEMLREEFAKILDDKRNRFRIYTFQEAQGLKGFRGLSGKIVEDASSSLGHSRERRDFINANHMAMCRFSGQQDEGYRKVKWVISRWINEVRYGLELDPENNPHQMDIIREEILETLYDSAFSYRFDQIEEAHNHTFNWLFNNSATKFEDWLSEGNGLYWISGKPGSGKSTLMKFALKDGRTQRALERWSVGHKLVTAGFFFYDRGSSLQKSFEGLLRSILHQLLILFPDVVKILQKFHEKRNPALPLDDLPLDDAALIEEPNSVVGAKQWKLLDLKEAILTLAKQDKIAGRVCLFVDALDEYDGRAVDIAEYINSLALISDSKKFQIKICAASRPWNVFQDLFATCPGIAIHDWTKSDISRYVMDTLQQSRRDGAKQLGNEIARRAEGVFLWVRLVLQDIFPLYVEGDPIQNILAVLSDLPEDLEGYYGRILQRIDRRYHRDAYLMIQIVISDPSISFLKFTLAMDLPLNDPSAFQCAISNGNDIGRCREMERRIKSRCGGLIEVRPNYPLGRENLAPNSDLIDLDKELLEGHVQFLHQTAKEFVQKPEVLDNILRAGHVPAWPAINGHVHLARFYSAFSRVKGVLPDYLFNSGKPEYARRSDLLGSEVIPEFLLHAEAAEMQTQEAQVPLIDEFNFSVTSGPSTRTRGLTWFHEWCTTLDLKADEIFSRAPFLAFALSSGLYLYCRAKVQSIPKPNTETLGYLLLLAVDPIDPCSSLRTHKGRYNMPSLEMVEFFLDNGANPNEHLQSTTPFYRAVYLAYCRVSWRKLRLTIIKLLLARGANPIQTYPWREYEKKMHLFPNHTLLHNFLFMVPNSVERNEERNLVFDILKTLLDRGIDPNAEDKEGLTALDHALPICPYNVIEYFIKKGAKITKHLLQKPDDLFTHAEGILGEERFRKPEFYAGDAFLRARAVNPKWGKGWLPNIGAYVRVS